MKEIVEKIIADLDCDFKISRKCKECSFHVVGCEIKYNEEMRNIIQTLANYIMKRS